MKFHRFIGDFSFSVNNFVVSDTEIVHQIAHVLKLQVGEYIILGDGKGMEACCEILQIEKNGIQVYTTEVYTTSAELDIKLILFCSILKKEHFEWVVQKSVELGVVQIIPLNCERTIKSSFNKNRLQKIIKEAAEQSGRGFLPQLFSVREFKNNIFEQSCRRKILFDGSGIGHEILESKIKKRNDLELELYIGPEGGWTQKELALASDNNIEIMSLGKTTLRAETAAIAALCWARFL
jgi:16S rRNA (uracil1498-N3)-methyltransferase